LPVVFKGTFTTPSIAVAVVAIPEGVVTVIIIVAPSAAIAVIVIADEVVTKPSIAEGVVMLK